MRFEPHAYQQKAAEIIYREPYCAAWMDMGLGKTAVALSVWNDLRFNRFEVGRTLIVAPKKVADATWQDEIKKWDHLHMLRVSTILGTAKQRMKALQTPADLYVINRDNLAWLVDTLKNKWFFDAVILDEASSFKSHSSKRFKALKAVRPRLRRVLELTGTPAPKGYLDLWAQIFILDQGQRLGKTYSAYRDCYFYPTGYNGITHQRYGYVPRPGSTELIDAAISDVCFSMSADDYLDLPEFIVDDIPVVLDPEARKAYDELEEEFVLELDEENVLEASTSAVLRNKLLQLAGGSAYDEHRRVIDVHSCKLEAFEELVEALAGEPLLVFYAYQHECERILESCRKMKVEARLFSGDADKQDWNAGKIPVLLAHPASCAYGLNMQQGGHHLVWYTLTDSLELYQQATCRLYRQGQTKPVIAHRLIVKDSVDEDVRDSNDAKDASQALLMDRQKLRVENARNRASEKRRKAMKGATMNG